jgi:broad specificity phosphatase PhoE
MLTLVLTRHGLTDRSTPEQHLGQRIDVSINDAGRRQAEALARRLAPVAFDRVFTSPLFRARETAALLVRSVEIEADPRLREMDYGAWEGRTYDQIAESDGDFRREWERSPDVLACPGGESGNDVAERVRGFLGDLLDEHRSWHAKASFRAATSGWGSTTPKIERPVLAVAHSTTNRVLICVALAIEIREFRHRLDQDQANLTVLQWELEAAPDEGRMLLMNDTAHLRRANEVPWA